MLCVLCVLCGLLCGCQAKPGAIDKTQQHLEDGQRAGNSAQAYAESGMSALADLAGYVAEAGKPLYDVTVRAFEKMSVAQAAAQEANAAAQGTLAVVKKEHGELQDENTTLRESFWSVRQKHLFWTVVWIVLAVVALRVFAAQYTGWIGTLASLAATGLLGGLTGGLSLIQAGFDNLWFRWRAKKAETPDVHPGLNEGTVDA